MRPVRGQVRNLMMIWKPHDGRCHPKPGPSTVAVKLHLCKCNNRSCHPTAGTMFCCRWKPTTRKKRDREKRSGKRPKKVSMPGRLAREPFRRVRGSPSTNSTTRRTAVSTCTTGDHPNLLPIGSAGGTAHTRERHGLNRQAGICW